MSAKPESPGSSGGGGMAPLPPPPAPLRLDASTRHPLFEEGASLLEFSNALLRRWKLVAGLPAAAGVAALLISLVVPPSYTATTTFVPESPSLGERYGGLTGLASQFGLTLGSAPSQSPQFYADVLKSRELMERVLLARYPDPRSGRSAGDSATLVAILDRGGDDAADSLFRAVKRLRKLVSTRVDRRTSVVGLNVDARDPALAALVANRFVEYLNEFNARSRQSQARKRREFAEDRLSEARQELRAAEQDLRAFYERNRSWQQAPQLLFEEGRLRRQVDARQEVYLTLNREYETARIEEVNDIPVITVVDPAVPPEERSKPRRLMVLVLALVGGLVTGVVLAFGLDGADRLRREDDGEYREFRGLLRGLRADLRRMALGGRRGAAPGRDRDRGPVG